MEIKQLEGGPQAAEAVQAIQTRLASAARSLGVKPSGLCPAELRRLEALSLELEDLEDAARVILHSPTPIPSRNRPEVAPAKRSPNAIAARAVLASVKRCRDFIAADDLGGAALAALEASRSLSVAEHWQFAPLRASDRARRAAYEKHRRERRRESKGDWVIRKARTELALATKRNELQPNRKELAERIATKHRFRGSYPTAESVRVLLPKRSPSS